jgi:hypothetical protein
MNGDDELVTEKLEPLRERIYKLERELAELGFDIKRGVESYKVSELKRLLAKTRDKEKAKALLLELVNLHEQLYLELYNLAGLKRLNVDTDTPEKRLMIIKEWLLTGKVNSAGAQKNKFKGALKNIAEALERCQDDCVSRIQDVLLTAYKRDYDRYRVARWILSICVSYGGAPADVLNGLESAPVGSLAKKIAECAHTLDKEKLSKLIKIKGGLI